MVFQNCVQDSDTLAERLRLPAKPMGSPRVGSNPTGVDVVYKADGFMQGALGASRKLPTKLPLEILM